jgi:hypothetical protein
MYIKSAQEVLLEVNPTSYILAQLLVVHTTQSPTPVFVVGERCATVVGDEHHN